MQIFIKSGLCVLLVIFLLSGVVNGADGSKSKIVGEWYIFPSAECNMEEMAKWDFLPDGTVTGLSKNSNEKFSWEEVGENVVRIKTGNGDISYFAIDTFDNIEKLRSSPLLEDEAKWNSIKNEYSSESAYSGILYMFYFVPASKVKGDKYEKKVLRAISNVVYAAEVKEFDETKKLFDEADAKREKEEKEYLSSLEKKWGKKVAKAIFEKRIFIGMVAEQVQASIGEPINIDTIENGSGKVEAWEYSDKILYFKNGKLKTISTTTRQ